MTFKEVPAAKSCLPSVRQKAPPPPPSVRHWYVQHISGTCMQIKFKTEYWHFIHAIKGTFARCDLSCIRFVFWRV